MRISIGCDHGGLALKNNIVEYLSSQHQVIDCGTNTMDSCDYPDYGKAVGESVSRNESELGIVVCTTGIGISIACNKVKGIRCALCMSEDMAKMTRLHNDSNVLALGAKYTTIDQAKNIIDVFINGTFEGGRHQTRVDKIMAIEREDR